MWGEECMHCFCVVREPRKKRLAGWVCSVSGTSLWQKIHNMHIRSSRRFFSFLWHYILTLKEMNGINHIAKHGGSPVGYSC